MNAEVGARRFIEDNPNDPRCEPFHRKDGYNRVSRVLPDPASPKAWLCPGCGRSTEIFYGTGPSFQNGKYSGEDKRLCMACYNP